jgi:DNA-binding YbaB/EbfC family protein
MKNLAGMMKQAQQMQSKMQDMQTKLDAMELIGEAGAGLVKVTMNGKGDMRKIKIDPSIVAPADTELLEDLVLAATSDAKAKVEAAAAEEMQKVTGGLQLPPGMKLPF